MSKARAEMSFQGGEAGDEPANDLKRRRRRIAHIMATGAIRAIKRGDKPKGSDVQTSEGLGEGVHDGGGLHGALRRKDAKVQHAR